MLHEPALVILDEPTSGLDGASRAQMLAFVRGVAAVGTAVLYTTHYLPEVEELDADVVVLDCGRVVAQGPVAAIVARYSDTFVEVSFAGILPETAYEVVSAGEGSLLVRLAGGQSELPQFIGDLGTAAQRIQGLSIVPPSLDGALLQITGRRYHER